MEQAQAGNQNLTNNPDIVSAHSGSELNVSLAYLYCTSLALEMKIVLWSMLWLFFELFFSYL